VENKDVCVPENTLVSLLTHSAAARLMLKKLEGLRKIPEHFYRQE